MSDGTLDERRKKEGRTIFVRVRKRDHVFGKDLWDTADAGGDNVKPCTSGFEDGDAKRFGEGCVEEDGATDEDLVSECRGVSNDIG